MINSGSVLALTGNQTLMVIAGGAVALLIIIFLCFRAMSRPVPGYQAHEEPAQLSHLRNSLSLRRRWSRRRVDRPRRALCSRCRLRFLRPWLR